MKYLCLGSFNPKKMNALPEAEIEAVMGECRPHMEELYKTGQVIIDAGLDVAGEQFGWRMEIRPTRMASRA